MKDTEDLVGIDRSQGEIIVGVAPIVKVEAAQHLGVQQPGDDLLYILRLVVMPGIDQHQSLRSGRPGQQQRHTPIGNVGVIEEWLKRFVFDQ